MSKRSERLSTVRDITAHEEDMLAREMSACQQRLDEGTAQLQDLCAYRDELAGKLGSTGSAGTSVSTLLQQRAFQQKLELAIDQQREQVDKLQVHYQQARERWLARRSRQQAMSKAIERIQTEERVSAEDREQKATDELVNGRYARRRIRG